jgi:hypothetical protein
MKKGILQRLREGPVLGDGGYILELEEMAGVKPKSADAPRFATGDRNW